MKLDYCLSIIMPAHNEGKKIYNNLIFVDNTIQSLVNEYEIICIDDGSTDNTFTQAKKAAKDNEKIKIIHFSENRGKGNAIRTGVNTSIGDLIMFLDSDLDLSPLTIPDFIEVMERHNSDVVIGSKLHPDSIISYPTIRRIISYGYYVLTRILFNLNVRDTQTGMKLFKANVIKSIIVNSSVNGFAFDIEILSLINQKGYKIDSAPVILQYGRTISWGRIDLATIYSVFVDTINIFIKHILNGNK